MVKSPHTSEAKRAVIIEIIDRLQILPKLIEDDTTKNIVSLVNFIMCEYIPQPQRVKEYKELIKIKSISNHGVEICSDYISSQQADLMYEIAKKIAQDAGYTVSLHGHAYKA